MVFKSVVGALGSPLFRNSSLPEDPVILEEVKNPFKIVPYVYCYCSVNGSGRIEMVFSMFIKENKIKKYILPGRAKMENSDEWHRMCTQPVLTKMHSVNASY